MSIIEALEDVFYQMLSVIPNLIGAILLFLVGWIIAKLVAKVLKRVLVTLRIDSVGDKLNEIEFIEKSNLKIVPSKILSKIVYYILLLIFTIAATETLGMETVSNLISDLIAYIPYVISALIFMVIGLLFADFIKGLVLTALKSLGVPSARMISNFIFYFLVITVAMSALAQAKVNTEFLNSNITLILGAIVAAFAIGYGFASRDIIANFLASFYSKGKVNLGDMVTINNTTGEVIAMDNSSLTIQTGDKRVIIPLSKLTTEKIEIHAAVINE